VAHRGREDAGTTRESGAVGVVEVGHRSRRHAAELIVEAWGPTREDCLEEAVRGLVDSFADTTEVPTSTTLPFALEPGGDEELLAALFDEVLRLLDVLSLVPVSVTVEPTEDGGLAGCLDVVPLGQVVVTGALPRGVVVDRLQVDRQGALWNCQVEVGV
jgi:SHS2 domain-containing protein